MLQNKGDSPILHYNIPPPPPWFRDSSAQNHFGPGLLGPDVSAHFSIRDCSAHFSGTARPIFFFGGGGGGGGGGNLLFYSINVHQNKIYETLFNVILISDKACTKYAAPIWHPYYETQIGQVEKVQRTAARWTCRRWRNTSSVGDMLDDLEWPSLETRREQSSLTFFYKIHSGTVDLDKDKYLTPTPNLRRTRASHESQYTRYFAYSDALKNSFFPRTIPMWNSLSSSVVSSKTIEEFKAQI